MSARRRPHRERDGFTLIEVLISISVIAVLLAISLPAIGKGRATARTFKCKMSLRSVAFDFSIFADPSLHGDRGDDPSRYGPHRFSLETFMESQYCVDEFWCYGTDQTVTRDAKAGIDPMRCTEVAEPMTYRRATPCRAGAVGPSASISFGFNSRLYRVERTDKRNRPRVREVQMTSAVLSHGSVPLVWDVDGTAAPMDTLPIFSAPSLDSRGPYAGDRYWFPGARHAGQVNVALIDGSVHTTGDPAAHNEWAWGYQPPG